MRRVIALNLALCLSIRDACSRTTLAQECV